MDALLSPDWESVFIPRHSLFELALRASILYLAIYTMLRVVLRRQVGGIGTADVLVIVLISEVAGNGIAPSDLSVIEGAVLVATILCWSYLIEWLQYRFPAFERLVRAPRLKLIENGRMLRRNMREEFVTADELLAQLRKSGIEDCRTVKAAYMEADGSISVIEKEA